MAYLRAFTIGVLASVLALFVWLVVVIARVHLASDGSGIGPVDISMLTGVWFALGAFLPGFGWAVVQPPRERGTGS